MYVFISVFILSDWQIFFMIFFFSFFPSGFQSSIYWMKNCLIYKPSKMRRILFAWEICHISIIFNKGKNSFHIILHNLSFMVQTLTSSSLTINALACLRIYVPWCWHLIFISPLKIRSLEVLSFQSSHFFYCHPSTRS